MGLSQLVYFPLTEDIPIRIVIFKLEVHNHALNWKNMDPLTYV